ncbi:MAG TPA: hypothetical protein VIE91_08760 [Methylophilaceae bacterium]
MNRRLYFMLPDISAARHAWKEMLLACVDNRNIHFLIKPGTNLAHRMQPADVLERTDALHEGGMGILVGAALGLIAGILTLVIPPGYFPLWYTNLEWTGILAITSVVGAFSGCVGMALLGVGLSSSVLEAAKERISKGEVMMIVAVPLHRVNEIRRVVETLHPEANYYGVWPAKHPVFP